MPISRTPFYIEILDAAGKKATGYIGAVGAGETLGSELFLNPDFGADTNWEKQTGWTIAAGVASNDGIAQGWLRQYVSPSIGKLVKMSVNITIATSGELYLLISPNFNPHLGPYNTIGIKSGYLIKDNDDLSIGMFVYPSFNGSIDDASAKRVTDPPPTAVHIVSSLNGTIRNWASIESGFNPNDIASWKIYHASLFSEVDRLIIPAGHNLNGLACSLRYSTDNFSADDHEAVGWTQGNALIISKSFTAQTKQYWKLNITAPATIVELTEMFLSKDYTFERNVNLNLNEEIQRNVERDQTKSGDPRWVKLGEKKESRVYDLIVESAQKINLDSWWSALDSVKPFYIFDHNGDLLFMEMLNELSFTPLSNNFWQTKMEFLEVL